MMNNRYNEHLIARHPAIKKRIDDGGFFLFNPLHAFIFGFDGKRTDVTDSFTSELVSNPNLSNGFSPLLPLTDTDFVGQYLADLDNWSVVNTPTVFEVQQILGSVRACRITADSVGDGARTASFTAGAGTTYRAIIRHYHHNADGIRYRVYDNQNAIEEVNVLDPVPGTGYATQILTWTQTTDSNDVYLEFTSQTSGTDYSILYIDLKESGPPTSWQVQNAPTVLQHVESVNGLAGTAYVQTSGSGVTGVEQDINSTYNAGEVYRVTGTFYKEDNNAVVLQCRDKNNGTNYVSKSYTTAGLYTFDETFTVAVGFSRLEISFFSSAVAVFQVDSVSLVGDIPDTWSLKNYGSAGDDAVASGVDFSTFFINSQYGTADGINDEFQTGSNSGLTGTGYSIVAVFKTTYSTAIQTILGQGDAAGNGTDLFLAAYFPAGTERRIYFNFFNSGGYTNGPQGLDDDNFFHITVLVPSGAAREQVRVYINGSEVSAYAYFGASLALNLGAAPLQIMKNAIYTYFAGQMSELHIFDRELTEAEISQHYNGCYSKVIGLL